MSRVTRKNEHIMTALQLAAKPTSSGFADVTLVHNALPEVARSRIGTSTQLFGKQLAAPVIINAMTGGGRVSRKINESLATAARETGLAIAVGSQTVALEDRDFEDSFRVVRRIYPDGLIMANIGARANPDSALRAVEMISADVLQVHLNAPQETAMPEGERDFRGWLYGIGRLVREAGVPVVVKEVGFGLSYEVVHRLHQVGVVNFDVGGRGGTNFIAIEDMRSANRTDCLHGWGITTAASLVETVQTGLAENIIATGGIRTGLDVAKALALGANSAGMAGYCLQVLFQNKLGGLIGHLEKVKCELKNIMQMLGVARAGRLTGVPLVITGRTREWLTERGIDTGIYARRCPPG